MARVTIAAIAREAGVSVPTVSKVVNGRTEVAPETRARIELATTLIIRKSTAPKVFEP